MSESAFVPLSPRRLHPRIDIESGADAVAAIETDDVARIEVDASEGDAAQATMAPEVALPDNGPGTVPVDVALDAARIRAAAISLAAAACARALRYAVDRNPRLLARFVDDALRAAGSPQHAVVRLAPSAAMSGGENGDHDYVADASLSPYDVFVDSADGTLGATIEQRAQGLVRAVSS